LLARELAALEAVTDDRLRSLLLCRARAGLRRALRKLPLSHYSSPSVGSHGSRRARTAFCPVCAGTEVPATTDPLPSDTTAAGDNCTCNWPEWASASMFCSSIALMTLSGVNPASIKVFAVCESC